MLVQVSKRPLILARVVLVSIFLLYLTFPRRLSLSSFSHLPDSASGLLSFSFLVTDSFVSHSATSLIVHARSDARNGVACSAINGTLRFSIGHLFVDEFIRSRVHDPTEPADRIGRDGVPRLVHVYTHMYISVHV